MPEVLVEIQFSDGWIELPVWTITYYGEGNILEWAEDLFWKQYPDAVSINARCINA